MKSDRHIPPASALKLLKFFLKEDLREEVVGDLAEQFGTFIKNKSPRRAKLNFWWQVLNYIRPFAIKKLTTYNTYYNTMGILQHNFVMSFRYFRKNKISFIINMLGLPAGLACTLLIYLWVNDELHVDQFHFKSDRLYEIMENVVQDGKIITRQSTSGLMAQALAAEMPEVENAATVSQIGWLNDQVLTVKDKDIESTGIYADSGFFRMFTFPLLEGNGDKALTQNQSIVLSEKLSKSLFGDPREAMGKMVTLQHDKTYMVSGIMKDVPARSSWQFDFILPLAVFRVENDWINNWYNTAPYTFVLFRPGTDVAAFNRKIAGMVKSKTGGDVNHRTPFAARFSEFYLHNHYVNGFPSGGRIEYVKLFSVIAVFILLIACINFMNLSTARASTRMKEIGIKKAIGAGRTALILQYLGEALILSFLSLAVALLIVWLLLPEFNFITGKQLVLTPDKNLILAGCLITFMTGLIAGSYPALYLSGFSPIGVLKGKIKTASGEIWARKGLVVFQFIVSVTLIVSVLVVYKQMEYVQTRNLGFNNDHILVLFRRGSLQKNEKAESFLDEVQKISGVSGASAIGHSLAGHNGGTYGIVWSGKDPNDKTEFERMPVDYGVIGLLGMKLAEGRAFSREHATDTSSIIFNEAAIKFMGLTDPVGKTVKLWGKDREIVGVVKDFNFDSFRSEVKPAFFWVDPDDAWNILVKIESGKTAETIDRLQKLYKEFNPGFPMDYRFMDQEYLTLYTAEIKVSALSKYFAGLAILISCLGLFGLAAFTAERRTREIGIRKILGSSEFGIIRLLTVDFTLMVIVAIIVALPASYLIAHSWLQGYAFHVRLGAWFFIAAGLAALLIAWITVGIQTLKAARINPVNCLKEE